MNTFDHIPATLKITRTEMVVTDRQREVWRQIAEGFSTKEIASNLGISVKTVETHRTNLMQRLGAKNAADLTRAAVKFGIITVAICA